MMLFDGVLRPVITHSWKQSFHPSSFNDQQQGCLGLRELAAKGEKKLSKSQELKWTPLEKIYFRIKRLILGFHFVTAMGCGNKCHRAGGDLRRPSSITENYLLPPKVVFEPSGLHLRCDWIMAVWHTPLMELSHRHHRAAWAVASKKLFHVQAYACAVQDGGDPPGHCSDFRGYYAEVPGKVTPLIWCRGDQRVKSNYVAKARDRDSVALWGYWVCSPKLNQLKVNSSVILWCLSCSRENLFVKSLQREKKM